MENDTCPRETGGFLSEKQIEYYLMLSGLKTKLGELESKRFVSFAREFGLNPFRRELHCLFEGTGATHKAHIVVGYEVYIKRAERTGLLDGWTVRIEGVGEAMKAILQIHRKDWAKPFIHEAYWAEAVQKTETGALTPFWQRMPRFQLKKVAISQGFRLCFSDELGGMPYEAAELSIMSPEIPKFINPAMDEAILRDGDSSPQAQALKSFDPQTFRSPFIDLDHFLKDNAKIFTASHVDWINSKLQETHTEEKARAMLAYARKFVRDQQAGIERSPKTRYPAKPRSQGQSTAIF